MNETDKLLDGLMADLTRDSSASRSQSNTQGTFYESNENDFVLINFNDSKINDFYICRHQVTQKEFFVVMGVNPSFFQTNNRYLTKYQLQALEKQGTTEFNPVDYVSYYDAIYYCNRRSLLENFTPIYSVNKEINPDKWWNYKPCTGDVLEKISINKKANGYRLPNLDEWEHAAWGGGKYSWYPFNNIWDFAWDIHYFSGSGSSYTKEGWTHPVMQKKPNGYGLYDMLGNVHEWANDKAVALGGSCNSAISPNGTWNIKEGVQKNWRYKDTGFRVVRSAF